MDMINTVDIQRLKKGEVNLGVSRQSGPLQNTARKAGPLR